MGCMLTTNVSCVGCWVKVRSILLGCWINSPREHFHLCKTEFTPCFLTLRGACLVPPTESGSIILPLWSVAPCPKVKVWEMVWQSKINPPIFLFHFKLSKRNPRETLRACMCLITATAYTHFLIRIYWLLHFKKYELGIVAPHSLFWAAMSVKCNMTKANNMSHQTLWSGSIVLKGLNVCQTDVNKFSHVVSQLFSATLILSRSFVLSDNKPTGIRAFPF